MNVIYEVEMRTSIWQLKIQDEPHPPTIPDRLNSHTPRKVQRHILRKLRKEASAKECRDALLSGSDIASLAVCIRGFHRLSADAQEGRIPAEELDQKKSKSSGKYISALQKRRDYEKHLVAQAPSVDLNLPPSGNVIKALFAISPTPLTDRNSPESDYRELKCSYENLERNATR